MTRLADSSINVRHAFFDQDLPAVRPLPMDVRGLSTFQKVWRLLTFKREWELLEDYCLSIPWLGITIFIPAGFTSDFASVPRFFWPLLNPTGVLLMGSLAHDIGYRYGGIILVEPSTRTLSFKQQDRAFLDNVLADVTKCVCGLAFPGNAAKLALTLGNKKAWDDAREENRIVAIDFPELNISK